MKQQLITKQNTVKQGNKRNNKFKEKNIKIDSDLHSLLDIYCTLNSVTIKKFTSQVIREKLKEFRTDLNKMRRLGKL